MTSKKPERHSHITIISNKAVCNKCGGESIYVKDFPGLKCWKWVKTFKKRHRSCQ